MWYSTLNCWILLHLQATLCTGFTMTSKVFTKKSHLLLYSHGSYLVSFLMDNEVWLTTEELPTFFTFIWFLSCVGFLMANEVWFPTKGFSTLRKTDQWLPRARQGLKRRSWLQRGLKEFSSIMKLLHILMVVAVRWLYAFVETHKLTQYKRLMLLV